MDYETDLDNKPINFQFIGIILIALVITTILFYPFIFKEKKTSITPVKNESKVIQIEYITVLVTPTPDGKLYYASEQEEGIRKIQNPFSFYADNASGHKRMKVISTVYDYKIFDKLHWHNPSDNKDYEMLPQTGNKFLFVFYAMYLDDRTADDTRYYIPDSSKYVIQSIYDNNHIYYPIDYPYQLRILEMENSRDYTNTIEAQYFGTTRYYSKSSEYRKTAGETYTKNEVLRGGKSNAQSGYIVYEIPSILESNELIAGINFGSFGTSWWRLKP